MLQHGQTPLEGVDADRPIIRDDGGDLVKSFTATPTGKTGVYHADVVFPSEGTWSYQVYDGFGVRRRQTHTFKPVVIGGGDSGFPSWLLALASRRSRSHWRPRRS